MTTIKAGKSVDAHFREHHPYLFEGAAADLASAVVVEDRPDSQGEIYVQIVQPEYVPIAVRDRYKDSTRPHLQKLADQTQRWGGSGLYLSRKKARKLGYALLLASTADPLTDD